MLRILRWRLIYHVLCLAKRLGYRGPRVSYFAYGGNLDPAVLQRRHIEPWKRTEHWHRDYQLRFNHSLPFAGAAMASIEPCPGAVVPGVLYEISKIDEWRLDCMESCTVLHRYGKERFTHPVAGPSFFYRTRRAEDGLRPTRAYLDKILAGYGTMTRPDPSFLARLKETPTLPAMVPKNPPHFLVRNYDRYGAAARPWLVRYDQKCVTLFASLIFKPSPFE